MEIMLYAQLWRDLLVHDGSPEQLVVKEVPQSLAKRGAYSSQLTGHRQGRDRREGEGGREGEELGTGCQLGVACIHQQH